MAKSHYRLYSNGRWQAMSGNAIVALTNPTASGKRIVVESLEMTPLAYNATAITGTNLLVTTQIPSIIDIGFCTAASDGAATVVPKKTDSASSAWPSGVIVSSGGCVSSLTTMKRVAVMKRFTAAGTTDSSAFRSGTSFQGRNACSSGGVVNFCRSGAVNAVTIRPGECWAAIPSTFLCTVPLRTQLILSVDHTTEAVYAADFFTPLLSSDRAVVMIRNPSDSGRVIRVLGIQFQEVGTFDSAYFRLVPIGSVVDTAVGMSDNLINSQVYSLDTTTAALSSTVCKVFQDVPILPFGVPQSYIAESSAGSPKGYNYLHTKDFDGPMWSAFFAEVCGGIGNGADGMALHLPQAGNRWKCDRFSKITLREGEGLALVASAETATGTTPVGTSGWAPFNIGINFSLENATTPSLTLTGLKNPTEIAVYTAGTQTLLAAEENVATGTFSWQYEYSVGLSVDIQIVSFAYQIIRLTSVALNTTGLTIPIQQVIDRVASNP